MAEWIECTLGDLITLQRGHDLPKSKMQEGRYPVVASNGIIGFHNAYTTDEPSITIGRSGNVGKPFIYYGKTWSHNTTLYVKDFKGNNPTFIFYLLKTIDLANYAGGSAVPTLNRNHIHTLSIKVPSDIKDQKIIGDFLKLFDDKIEENARINNHLLEQASTLFNHAIQQSNSVSYTELGLLADVKGGKRLPKGVNLITIPNKHPYIRVRDLNNVVFASLSNDYEYVDDETQKSISQYIVSTGDVLISIVGTIGLTAIVDWTLDKANLTENCVKLTNLKKVTPEYLLLFLRSLQGIEAISRGTVGAVQLKLPIKNIQSIAVPLLCVEELQPLYEMLSAIFSQISTNIVEMKQLADIRDTLLPKLMSGELNVSDIDL